mmetsp:Transcript_24633/g.47908  ORF Transcript_24633/g.47908 Transcript_24633/m.47908 type:complete len:469 (+) Transcript_24633:32-1438(+)|eukprot:CAMPEP_0173382544 /NCGR_PEP_ID=MMETSP1356-20130122/5065_1 /TAXON_ID=77927 ORGANISM="Hemiselmis virescens, Strain PCC157" /NCGR_SAMPLE_ID=MMETSP1356 /ASSEMBLY_ACC=CAM_ASM_000847 /LENGTH=468 /DNA_ID=CAMNT_0014336953 /DNA_START=17 /DNA_END=1423 /DNA_ORIENTATION=-
MADAHKAQGNEFFRNDRFAKALECYTKAIELDPKQGALYSNRSACYAELEKWMECYDDALECIKLRPDWPKAYYRYALALLKIHKINESRGVCNAGLALEADNKDLLSIKKQAMDKIVHHFKNASSIDFKMDVPPNDDFKIVASGKTAVGDVSDNAKFGTSIRSLLHVGVMMNFPKVVKDLVDKGVEVDKEDRMGLTPLHFAELIQNDAVLTAFGEKAKLQPLSSSHMATPGELREATQFASMQPDHTIKAAIKGSNVAKLSGMEFAKTFGCFYKRTQQLSIDWYQCMLSSVLDEEGQETVADPHKLMLSKSFRETKEESNLAIAYAGDDFGYGVFALEDFKAGDYVTCYSGVVRDKNAIKPSDQARTGLFMTIMPLDKMPFKTDATLYRSLGAFVNHSDTPNLEPHHVVVKASPMVLFVAKTDIKKGDQLSFDYRGRLHDVYCTNNIPNFKPLKPLDGATLAALCKL